MECPHCGKSINKVIDSRPFQEGIGIPGVAGNVWLVQAGSTHMNPQKDNWYGF